MASQTPIVIQNENLPIHRGKAVDGKVDPSKPAKVGRQDRKALRDLSKTGKPPVKTVLKGSTLKEKPTVHGHQNTKNASKLSFLTDEEIKRCNEWAKEGIEGTHFTGNDLQKLQRERHEERVRKKVEKVMSALQEWTNMTYNLGLPMKEVADDIEDITKMELVPEELPPRISVLSDSGKNEAEDLLLEPEHDPFPYIDHIFELKLKEEHDCNVAYF